MRPYVDNWRGMLSTVIHKGGYVENTGMTSSSHIVIHKLSTVVHTLSTAYPPKSTGYPPLDAAICTTQRSPRQTATLWITRRTSYTHVVIVEIATIPAVIHCTYPLLSTGYPPLIPKLSTRFSTFVENYTGVIHPMEAGQTVGRLGVRIGVRDVFAGDEVVCP